MRTFIFIPPLRKHTGGVAILLEIAACLHQAGHEVYLVPREDAPPADHDYPPVPICPWNELELTKDDIWLVPEGWVNALAPGLQARARCVVYCQNWAYLFSALPENVAWMQLPVHFIAVSQPVAWFIQQTTGRPSPILRACVDTNIFKTPETKPKDRITIAYMPRKNKALASQIKDIFLAKQALKGNQQSVRWVEISGMDQQTVAQMLRDAHIFLATGFPEGFSLPPLEAMASGCLPVGFGGFGGWDYMRQAYTTPPAGNFEPWFPLRPDEETPWGIEGGNGFWVADADVVAAGFALQQAVDWWATDNLSLAQTLDNAQKTAQAYNRETFAARVLEIWTQARAKELFS